MSPVCSPGEPPVSVPGGFVGMGDFVWIASNFREERGGFHAWSR